MASEIKGMALATRTFLKIIRACLSPEDWLIYINSLQQYIVSEQQRFTAASPQGPSDDQFSPAKEPPKELHDLLSRNDPIVRTVHRWVAELSKAHEDVYLPGCEDLPPAERPVDQQRHVVLYAHMTTMYKRREFYTIPRTRILTWLQEETVRLGRGDALNPFAVAADVEVAQLVTLLNLTPRDVDMANLLSNLDLN